MNGWTISACLLAATALPAAAADVRLESYRNPKNETFRQFNQLYLDGVRGGLKAANAWLTRHGGKATFCLPDTLALTSEQTEEIMFVGDQTECKGRHAGCAAAVVGLQDRFPCDGGRQTP